MWSFYSLVCVSVSLAQMHIRSICIVCAIYGSPISLSDTRSVYIPIIKPHEVSHAVVAGPAAVVPETDVGAVSLFIMNTASLELADVAGLSTCNHVLLFFLMNSVYFQASE